MASSNLVLLLITLFAGYVAGAVGGTSNMTIKKLVASVFAVLTTSVLALGYLLSFAPTLTSQAAVGVVAANVVAILIARFLSGRLGDRLQGVVEAERLGVELWRVRAWRDFKVTLPQNCQTAASAAEAYWIGYWQELAQKQLQLELPASSLTSAAVAADAYVAAWWHKRARDVFGVPLPADAVHAPLAVSAYEQLAQQLGVPVAAK